MQVLPLAEAAIEFANRCIGYQEYKGNQGFQYEPFDNIMRQNGFQNGWAWCMLFARACYTVPMWPGKSKLLDIIEETLTPGVVDSYNRAKKSDHFIVSDYPIIGSIAMWRRFEDGKATIKGHAGLTVATYGNKFGTIEGNTNSEGGREGIEVAHMAGLVRQDLTEEPVYNGLNFLGFIIPKL